MKRRELAGAYARGLYHACGLDDVEDRPLVGIANSWNEMVPGHVHLDKLAEAVKYFEDIAVRFRTKNASEALSAMQEVIAPLFTRVMRDLGLTAVEEPFTITSKNLTPDPPGSSETPAVSFHSTVLWVSSS